MGYRAKFIKGTAQMLAGLTDEFGSGSDWLLGLRRLGSTRADAEIINPASAIVAVKLEAFSTEPSNASYVNNAAVAIKIEAMVAANEVKSEVNTTSVKKSTRMSAKKAAVTMKLETDEKPPLGEAGETRRDVGKAARLTVQQHLCRFPGIPSVVCRLYTDING